MPTKSSVARGRIGPVAVLGIGNLGTALAWALHSAGIPVAELITRSNPSAAQVDLAQECRAKLVRWRDWKTSLAKTLWICVPDDQIAVVAAEIATRFAGKKQSVTTFLHASGARSYRELEPLSGAGTAIGAAHPFRSFPRPQRALLKGTYFAVEGDVAARNVASATVRLFGGIPFKLRARALAGSAGAAARQTGDKALYHTFGTFCSPLLVALLAASVDLGAAAGVPAGMVPRMIASLSGGSMANWQRAGAAASFSGPIARGDIETIRLHLASLSGMPEYQAIYCALSSYAAVHLPAKKRAALLEALLPGAQVKEA